MISAGLPTGRIDIPDEQNATGIYAEAVVTKAAHPAEAKLWLDFLMGTTRKRTSRANAPR